MKKCLRNDVSVLGNLGTWRGRREASRDICTVLKPIGPRGMPLSPNYSNFCSGKDTSTSTTLTTRAHHAW